MYREYFGFYCGPPHSLFGKKKLSIKDLQDLPILSFNTDRLLDVLRPVALYRNNAQLEGKIIGLSSSLEEVRRMINCGLGYGPLPYHVVKDLPHSDKLWQLPPYKFCPQLMPT